MAKEPRRSTCPINAGVEILGDRWSLLVVRELMVRGPRSYKELAALRERIATNVLADRLEKLTTSGIISAHADPDDGRRVVYRLTEKGIELAPVLRELAVWATKHEPTSRPPSVIAELIARTDARGFANAMRKHWASDDPLVR